MEVCVVLLEVAGAGGDSDAAEEGVTVWYVVCDCCFDLLNYH